MCMQVKCIVHMISFYFVLSVMQQRKIVALKVSFAEYVDVL